MKKNDSWRRKDPYSERDDGRHRFPIPSRGFVLDVLEERGKPMGFDELVRILGLRGRERQAMEKRLHAMVRDGQLIRNRRDEYCLMNHIPIIAGRVIGHRDGFGFVVPDDGEEDIYLAPRQMREVFHGDRVAVRIKGRDRRGRPEGSLVEVLERATDEVVGRFFQESGIGFVVPDNPRISHQITIPPRKKGGAKHGQIVLAQIIEPPTPHNQPIGRVTRVLGNDNDPGMETQIAVHAHGLPHRWPEAVQRETADFPKQVSPAAKHDRVDLRDVPLVTIDGADARDFDDAVYCERAGSGWRLLVAIADVAHYVRPGSALDREAIERGTSVYFPNSVIPMLPEALSNGLCSLNPKVDRLCMVCEMRVNRNGQVTRSKFFEGVMRSQARLTYGQVAAMLVDKEARLRKRFDAVLPHLENLHDLFKAFLRARRKRGALDFDIPEVRMHFDTAGKIKRIVPYERNDAHRIIEECMIAANVQAARFLGKYRLPALYRVHDAPDAERVEELRGFLDTLGLKLPAAKRLTPQHYTKLIEQVMKRPDKVLIETVLLRSLALAVYQPANIGHFGLALDTYAHFTSPIRRYPDLLVHRGIKHVLQGGKVKAFRYAQKDMQALGERSSMLERRAEEATREAMEWLKCEFMLDKVGEEFDGLISGVTDFGLFVQLNDIQIEGLVHVTSLDRDYYQHDRVHHRLVGERSGKVYRLMDPIRVRVVRANLEERKIDFEPAERELPARGQSGHRRRRRSGARKSR